MPGDPTLLDRWGRPVRRQALKEEVAAPTLGGVRSPLTGYPGDGLDPVRLASILREADAGDAIRYLELAETIEERDAHYIGVLGTRRRSVSQLDITVEPASDAPRDVEIADRIRAWLRRDELTDELFDILDAIGKGYSATEIVWDTSGGQWEPQRLEWRDPRWFRFDRTDLETPLMLDEHGAERPLPPFKFIFTTLKAKSGLTLRSGLARVAAWAWLFKAYTQRDWAIFTQTYGQPLRVGKWGAGASEADKDTLFRAVANIAGDCAAIIPEAMSIEFVKTEGLGATAELYERRADWLDRQVSKAVLGQTTTTDAVSGGHAVSQEHRQVQEDIERADARALAGTLNRDLVRPWVDLEWGPQARYPRIAIAREEAEDLSRLAQSLGVLVPLGLRVGQAEIRAKFRTPEPAGEDDLLAPAAPPAAPPEAEGVIEARSAKIKGGSGVSGVGTAAREEGRSASDSEPLPVVGLLTAQMGAEAGPAMAEMVARIEAMLEAAGSLEEFRAMLLEAWPELDGARLAEMLAAGLVAAHAAGRVAVEEGE